MALVEVNRPSGAFDFARGLATPVAPAAPYDALAQLSRLRDEAGQDLRLTRFLASAPRACMVLLVTGTLMALSSAKGLGHEFTWGMMLLAGIVAITVSHIRNFAVVRPIQSLPAAAAHLRGLLLYTGLAWGSGALLVLPAQPAPVLTFVFAVVPAALLGLILKDQKAAAAFAAPAAVVTVMAALLAGWPQALWISAAISAALPGIIAIPALQQNSPHRAFGNPVLR